MESTRRYRLLIYFAALVLCLSVCFANAEEIHPNATPTVSAMAFGSTQLHSTFMPALRTSFLATPTAAQDTPVVSAVMMQQVAADAQKSHRLFHHLSLNKRKAALVLIHAPVSAATIENASSASDDAGQNE